VRDARPTRRLRADRELFETVIGVPPRQRADRRRRRAVAFVVTVSPRPARRRVGGEIPRIVVDAMRSF
jgi:hypothetical protein